MSLKGDIAQMHRELEEHGWRLTQTGSKHLRCTAPNGDFVFSAATPSDYRGLKNFRARVRHIDSNVFTKGAPAMHITPGPLHLQIKKLNSRLMFGVRLRDDTLKSLLPDGTNVDEVYLSMEGNADSGLTLRITDRDHGHKLCHHTSTAGIVRIVWFEPSAYGIVAAKPITPKPVASSELEVHKGRLTIKRVPSLFKPDKVRPLQIQPASQQQPPAATIQVASKDQMTTMLAGVTTGLGIVGQVLLLVEMLNDCIDAAKKEDISVSVALDGSEYKPTVSYPGRPKPQPAPARNGAEAAARSVLQALQ